jgi:hypothetical protein
VREIIIPGVFPPVQFVDVAFEKPVGLADEINDAQAFIANLKTPDRHVGLAIQRRVT